MPHRPFKGPFLLILAGLMTGPSAASVARAELPPPAAPGNSAAARAPAGPATAPADAKQIQSLVALLGSENFRTRDDATAKLRATGKAALPALKEAANDPDPEVQTRARKLVKDIETPPKPPEQADPQRLLLGNGGNIIIHGGEVRINANGQGGNGVVALRMVVTAQNVNGVRDVNVNENGRQIRIHEDNDGLTMSVTEKDAKAPTEYKAKDAEDLKKNDPDAYKIYDQYAGNGGNGAIRIAPAQRR